MARIAHAMTGLRRSLGGWLPVTIAVVLAGIAVSVAGAASIASSNARDQRAAFRFATADIASSLKLSISHEEDLVVSTSAFVTTSHDAASPLGFDHWIEAVQALRRYPELQNVGLTKLVPASELAAFQAQRAADPIRPFGAHSRPAWEAGVVPATKAPFYCLASAGMARSPQFYVPVGLNYCALAPSMFADRDAGLANYAPVTVGTTTTLGVATPVYRGGVAPRTVAARRRAFVGWLGELLEPNVVLARALVSHPGVVVRFSYHYPGSRVVVFSHGAVPANAMRGRAYVHQGWMLESFAPAVSASLFENSNARLRLIGGILLSLLAASLIVVLATGRRRALAMVAAKTRELSYQATHDALTGLPNRALVLDRAQQLIARRPRHPERTAALYIDIDGFKNVNDTIGHAAGDELLRTCSERLRASLRDEDTVGRLGGDEFVVLLEARPEELDNLADRLNAALRTPVRLKVDAEPVSVTASIGIAHGAYTTPDDLLRDADLALYEAKAAGKNRYALFAPGRSRAKLRPPVGDVEARASLTSAGL